MKQWVIESIPFNYSLVQPVVYNWYNKGCGVYSEMCVCVIFTFLVLLVRSVQVRVFNMHI